MYFVEVYIDGIHARTSIATEKHKLLPTMQEAIMNCSRFLDECMEENINEDLEKIWMDVDALEKFFFMRDSINLKIYESAFEERSPFTFEAFKEALGEIEDVEHY